MPAKCTRAQNKQGLLLAPILPTDRCLTYVLHGLFTCFETKSSWALNHEFKGLIVQVEKCCQPGGQGGKRPGQFLERE